ncbi:MAG: acyl-CoA dehydrogenase family protein [Bacteriovoracaceae bacterium]|nr:acyl-CoA dehydrogenase family protein [Bacteriovoracaceae bacterium]
MKKYDSLNFIDFESLLTSEQKEMRDSVRKFVDDEVLPKMQKAFREEVFPKELIPRFGELGLLGANLKGYGCAGIDTVSYGLVTQEIERADSGIRSFVSVQGSLCMYPIYAYGNEAQKEKYLPRMARGEVIGCFGLTEPDFGSNPGGMITTAVEKSDGYVLNGNKMWITNGSIADVAIVWAKLNGVVRGFLVDKGTPGFSTSLMKGKFSLRASITSELHFENCKIPKENLLPKVEGLKGPLGCLSQARFGIAWGAIGAANACYHEALNYVLNRQMFDKPLAGYQLIQVKLSKMVQEISKAQLLCWHLSQLKERGELKPAQISLAKMNNVRMALDVARDARDMLGANGIIDEYPVIRHMMNLETVNTYEGTEDIHKLIIGREVTGLAAFN